VEVPKDLETLPCRIQSVVVVIDTGHHYILPRIPTFPTCFLLLISFLLSGIARQTYFHCPWFLPLDEH